MTHGRRPRKPRQLNTRTLATALLRASCLTDAEVRETIQPAQQCLDRLREGVATEDQHTVLHTCMQVALDIEASGIVHGLHEHLQYGIQALESIRARALATGTWRPTDLDFHELDALRTAVDLHRFQLEQLSAGELHTITARLIARTLSAGGAAVRTTLNDMGLRAA
jgi:hypothetical protein